MRKITAMLVLTKEGLSERSLIHYDSETRQVTAIGKIAGERDSVALLEYYNGIIVPAIDGWRDDFTPAERAAFIATLDLKELSPALDRGYTGNLYLIEGPNMQKITVTPATKIRKL